MPRVPQLHQWQPLELVLGVAGRILRPPILPIRDDDAQDGPPIAVGKLVQTHRAVLEDALHQVTRAEDFAGTHPVAQLIKNEPDSLNRVLQNHLELVLGPVPLDEAVGMAFSFSDSGAVTLTYDAAAAKYLKTAYGAPQVDESTGAQLAFDNVLVLFTDIKLKNPDDPNNLVTDFAMSSGTGYYCYGGKFRAVTWEKGNPEDPLRLKDENGAALQVNVGKSYVAIVGKDREGTLLFGGVSPTGVIGGEGASSDAQSGAAASAEPEL